MSFGLLNVLMLLGLAGLAIPPLLHLLNRRRYDVVDWGAMQFLKVSQTTRRRLLVEELLLMLLRMALLGVLVLGLAAPYVESPVLAKLGGRANRDVVLVIDGSASMSETSVGPSLHQAAREWAQAFLADLSPGDSVAILEAREQVVPVVGRLTGDLAAAREALHKLPPPHGGCDWREAFRTAFQVLAEGHRPERELIVVTDNQRFGWSDDTSLLRWELFATELRQTNAVAPQVLVVNLAPRRPADLPNWSLAPLKPSRAVASIGQEIRFRTALELHGQPEYQPPHRLWLEVDGQFVADLNPPRSGKLDGGQVPFTFEHRFTTPGSHLVSLVVEPDPPEEQRPPGGIIRDVIPADNRQDYAVEVLPVLPVLLVDGDTRSEPKYRGTDFLRDALAPARDPNPSAIVRVIPIQEFDARSLGADVGKEPDTKPRVVVLSNVASLTATQEDVISQFLSGGGGVLVTLGDRVEPAAYNSLLYRGGQGWLPARLDDLAGDETNPARAVSPLASSFFHPALELFRDVPAGGLADARFPRWWKVTTVGRGSSGVPIALLGSNDLLFVERSFKSGRVILATVPLDNSWRTNLTDLPAFAPLAHELVFYLAGARGTEHNLQPGQPLRYRPPADDSLDDLTLQTPGQPPRSMTEDAPGPSDLCHVRIERGPHEATLVYEETRTTGVYRLRSRDGSSTCFVVQPDPRESDLTPCSAKEREQVAKFVPMTHVEDRDSLNSALVLTSRRLDVWWLFLVGVLLFLCAEVWLTRRIVRGR